MKNLTLLTVAIAIALFALMIFDLYSLKSAQEKHELSFGAHVSSAQQLVEK